MASLLGLKLHNHLMHTVRGLWYGASGMPTFIARARLHCLYPFFTFVLPLQHSLLGSLIMPQLRYCLIWRPFHTFAVKIPSGSITIMDFLALVGEQSGSDHTHSGPTLAGPSTGSTVAVTLLGGPGENVAKVGTILPLPYQPLYLSHRGLSNIFSV